MLERFSQHHADKEFIVLAKSIMFHHGKKKNFCNCNKSCRKFIWHEVKGISGKRQKKVARETGLEPATSTVTGWHSNQLSYSPAFISGVENVSSLSTCYLI